MSILASGIPSAGTLRRYRWPLIVAVWMVPALLAAFETGMFWRLGGKSYPLWRAVASEAPAWLVYAAVTPLVLALARRLPLQRGHFARNLSLHLLFAQLTGTAYALVASAATVLFSPIARQITFTRLALSWYLSALPLATLTYFGVLGVGAALIYLDEARRREMDAARLATQLAEARLGALQMQLHPHFLFNTLNAITVLARDGDTRSVVRMLTLLSELLRDVLHTDRGQTISLDEELSFSRRYLDIELVRFADRLQVRERIDEAARAAMVPVFILQPLIENALRHGIAPRADGGFVEIGARVVDERLLELWVRDDGAGLRPEWRSGDDYGIGLSNGAARLRELFGDAATLSLSGEPSGGTRATVRIPFRHPVAVA